MENNNNNKEIAVIEEKTVDKFTNFLGSWKFIVFRPLFLPSG